MKMLRIRKFNSESKITWKGKILENDLIFLEDVFDLEK